MPQLTADDIVRSLGLTSHPEGGAFRETYRSKSIAASGHSCATLIYFMLRAGEISAWHRVMSGDEHFLYHGGDPYVVRTITLDVALDESTLGMDLTANQAPQYCVPAKQWQSAYVERGGSFGWSLVACMVSPGFDFSDFEMASDEEMALKYPHLGDALRLPR
jgi:hypothetical protein